VSKRAIVRERRGVTLVVVLWMVAVLATVTAVASSGARSSAQLAMNRRALATARAMAESGVAAATAFVNDSLAVFAADTVRRDAFLARLEPSFANSAATVEDSIGEGVFAATFVDVSARLDVNAAGVDGMTTLLRSVMADGEARALASRIDSRVRGTDVPSDARDERADAIQASKDSLTATLLGRVPRLRLRHPFESLDELLLVRGVDENTFAQIAPLLTVDGDGTVNQRAAAPLVLAAATGTLVDRPTRLLCIARGWQRGHPLTREIQAVYDIAPDGLRLVRWRESGR